MHIIHKYFPNLSPQQSDLLDQLDKFYQDWGQQVNLISKKDLDHILERHFLHSLSIAKFIQFPSNSNVLDLGTGGGLPGLPLAILFPETKFTLMDSISKKIKIVEQAIKKLDLENVSCKTLRAEDESKKYDFILTRAVAKMDTLKQWCKPILSKKSVHDKENGLIALKGGDLSDELKRSPKASTVNISDYFDEPFFETKKIIYVPLSSF